MTIRLNPSNLTQTRSDLGLGDAATKTVGVANGNVIAADATGIPAINGSQVTALNATNLATGTVATARMGSGTASSSTFLRGDGSWQTAGGAWSVKSSGSLSGVTNLDITGLTKTIAFYFSNVKNSSDGIGPDVFFSTDNGSNFITTSTYDYSTMHADQNNQPGIQLYAAGPGNDTNETHSGHFILYGPNVGTGIAQAITFSVIYPQTNGNAQFFTGGGYLPTASAVNAVRFRCLTGATAGTFVVLELN